MHFFYFLMSIFNFSEVLFFWKRLLLNDTQLPLDLGDYVHVLVDVYACRYIMHVCAYGGRV